VDGDLVEVGPTGARVSILLRARLAAALAPLDAPAARAAGALAALTEIALAMGDALRAAAQGQLATLPEEEQRRWLTAGPAAAPGTDASIIMAAAHALLGELAD
jgi:hypothetical protein